MFQEFRHKLRILIRESLESQKGIEKLTDLILQKTAEKIFWRFSDYSNPDDLRKIDYELVSHDFPDINIKKDIGIGNIYFSDTFQKFIEEGNVDVYYTSFLSGTRRGTTSIGQYHYGGYIYLSLTPEFLEQINREFNNENNLGGLSQDLLYVKLWYKFHSILAHELQHAYDYFISSGKMFMRKKTQKYFDIVQSYNIKSDSTPEESNKIFKKYLRLPHEVNARFTQAFQKIRMFKSNGFNAKIKKPFETVLSDFKMYYDHWDDLSPTMQRRLIQRLYTMWDKYNPNKPLS